MFVEEKMEEMEEICKILWGLAVMGCMTAVMASQIPKSCDLVNFDPQSFQLSFL
jgi:hypothetical protein